MQKLDRSGTASRFVSPLFVIILEIGLFDLRFSSFCSIASSVGTTAVNNTGLTLPPPPILGPGAAPMVPPVVAPLTFPALAGLGAGLQVPTSAVPTIDTIGVPSECLLLKDMFDPKVEVGWWA
jgi:RNA-binding protein 39